MWDELLKALLIAAGTAIAAEVGSKVLTDKWLHEHLYEWWRELSERIDAWVMQHQELRIAQVVAWVNCKLDNVAVGAYRTVKVVFAGISADKSIQPERIEEVELSAEEVAKQFPELQQNPVTVVARYEPQVMEMTESIGQGGEVPVVPTSTGRQVRMFTGKVKWFNQQTGGGCIQRDDGGKEVLVEHKTVVGSGFQTLAEGQKVSFEIVEDTLGAKAQNLWIIQK